MKTYKKVVEIVEPRLVIEYDEFSVSPREWDNLGYFITIDRKHRSPDKNERLENIIKLSGEVAESLDEHIRLIKENYNDIDDNILAIYPVAKYEHSGVSYSLGNKRGFDYSNNGFYIITNKTAENLGVKSKNFEKIVKEELEIYNRYINGSVYQFRLYDKKGEQIDACGGFYDIEEIRKNLPKEWKKEKLENYLKV